MPELAFATKGKFGRQDKLRFASFARSEYYAAEIGPIDDAETVDLRVEKGLSAPYVVASTRALTPYFYKRRWAHIEADRADICIVQYVVSGSIRATHLGARSLVEPGQFIVFRSNAPYELEYHPGGSGERSVFYASLPPDVVLRHFAGRSILGRTIAPPAGHPSIVGELFKFIFENGDRLVPDVANSLLSALIKDMAQIPTPADLQQTPPAKVQDYRLDKIWSYLALHFTNPDLTAAMVAEACRISPRYLSHLLASSGTSFSQILWNWRMEKAKRWLQSPSLQDTSIGGLALQAGYKSASHFTHAFKTKLGCTPSEYRKRFLGCGSSAQHERVNWREPDSLFSASRCDGRMMDTRWTRGPDLLLK